MSDLAIYGRVDGLQKRVASLEQVVQLLVEATGITVPTEVAAAPAPELDAVAHEILELLGRGKRAKAVGVAAKKRGLTLQEATAYVGELESTTDSA